MEAKLIKVLEHYHLYDGDKAIATTIIGNPMLLPNLSLKNCEAVANGYDLDELAEKHYDVHIKQGHTEEDSLQRKIDFILGFQKALEILGDKKFSEEQVLDAFYAGWISQDKLYLESKIIQKTKWDVEIEMESVLIGQCDCPCHDGEDMMHMMACCNPKMVDSPKLDAENCLILKRL